MKVGFLTRYASAGPSSRVRAFQYFPVLSRHDIEPVALPLLGDEYVRRLYARERSWRDVVRGYVGRLRRLPAAFDCELLWIEKELFPFVPALLESAILRGRNYVVDLDDALFHDYDLSGSRLVRACLGSKLDALMQRSSLVTAGNGYLAERALLAGAEHVQRLPSVIDLERYPPLAEDQRHGVGGAVRIVWIGSPATARYLARLQQPLQALATRVALQLRVIGAPAPAWDGVETLSVKWSADSEVAELRACDIGLMPLDDSPWEQGKCGFKLIQYMACGLPVVASAVGMNLDIVEHDRNGFLVRSASDWEQALGRLCADADLRRSMGRRGRLNVEAEYCLQVTGPRMAQFLHEAATRRPNPAAGNRSLAGRGRGL